MKFGDDHKSRLIQRIEKNLLLFRNILLSIIQYITNRPIPRAKSDSSINVVLFVRCSSFSVDMQALNNLRFGYYGTKGSQTSSPPFSSSLNSLFFCCFFTVYFLSFTHFFHCSFYPFIVSSKLEHQIKQQVSKEE